MGRKIERQDSDMLFDSIDRDLDSIEQHAEQFIQSLSDSPPSVSHLDLTSPERAKIALAAVSLLQKQVQEQRKTAYAIQRISAAFTNDYSNKYGIYNAGLKNGSEY